MPARQSQHDGLLLLLRAAETIDFHEKFDCRQSQPYYNSCHNPVAKTHSTSPRDSPTSSLSSGGRRLPSYTSSRCSHNELEKTRRAHLRNCMDSLKERLSFEGDSAASRITMLTVLKKASSTIQNLMHQNRVWEHRESKEKRRYNQLVMKRQELRKRRDYLLKTQSSFQTWRERNSASECSVTTTSSEDSEVDSTMNQQTPPVALRFAQATYGGAMLTGEQEESSDSGYKSSPRDLGAMVKMSLFSNPGTFVC